MRWLNMPGSPNVRPGSSTPSPSQLSARRASRLKGPRCIPRGMFSGFDKTRASPLHQAEDLRSRCRRRAELRRPFGSVLAARGRRDERGRAPPRDHDRAGHPDRRPAHRDAAVSARELAPGLWLGWSRRPWKATVHWKAVRRGHSRWVAALLLITTLGIVEILCWIRIRQPASGQCRLI